MKEFVKVVAAIGLACLLAISLRAEIVQNGGFETGAFDAWNVVPPVDPSDSSYWAPQVTGTGFLSGSYAVHFGSASMTLPDVIAQVLTTIPGGQYGVSFAYGEYNNNDPAGYDESSPLFNDLTVLIGGSPMFEASSFYTFDHGLTAPGDTYYTRGEFKFTAEGDSTTLEFSGYDFRQDVVLDDVSVFTPEPGSLLLLGTSLAALTRLRRHA